MSSNGNVGQLRPIIVDIGSSLTRIGFAGEDFPEIIAPSVYVDVAEFLFQTEVIDGLEDIFLKNNEDIEKYLFGTEALKFQNILNTREFKKENNFSIFLRYFYYYYKQLEIPSEYQFKQPIIVITPFYMSDLERKKLQQVFLDTFNFPSILFLSESQAIISTLNKTNGVIVNIGESNTSITSILHGFINPVARDVFPIAGKDLTTYLLNLIVKGKGTTSNFYIDKWIAKEIKEKTAICVMDPKSEVKQVREGLQKYDQIINLPNNYSLKINTERFMLSEPLFDPRLIHIDYKGLDEVIAEVIKLWERASWEDLVSNIILAGGGTLITGFKERLTRELNKHFPEKLKPNINLIAASGRENIAWIGGSILFIKNQLQKGWITKSD